MNEGPDYSQPSTQTLQEGLNQLSGGGGTGSTSPNDPLSNGNGSMSTNTGSTSGTSGEGR